MLKKRPAFLAPLGSKPTRRELQVLQIIARGRTMKHAADELGIAHKSVHAYTQRLRARLGARNLVHLGVLAERAGYLKANPPEQSRHGLIPQSVDPAAPTAAGGAA